jgi:bifunctional DNA-binding transcriptional regulator/antitoxin component of YhaV-PrlF toxin-antitoxin module
MSTKNSSEIWTVKVEEDQFGDLILPLPTDMLEELGWKEGDTLNWIDNENGSYTLSKVQFDSDSGLTESF